MDAVTKTQVELAQAEADARKAQIKADAQPPVNEDEHESACARAIHEAIADEEKQIEELEEQEEIDEGAIKWAEERIANLEAKLAALETASNSRHSELIAKLDELKPKAPLSIPLNSPPEPSPAPVNPAAILESKGLDGHGAEQQRRKVRKI